MYPAARCHSQANEKVVQVTATNVFHGEVPALAYRVDLVGVRIAFSGDTNGDNRNLDSLADAADVLVAHNAVPERGQGAERSLHTPPSMIGRIAHDAGVKRLVLSHRMLRTLGQEVETMNVIRDSYPGAVTFEKRS